MDYKATVFLPITTFTMKANLPEREPQLLEHWEAIDLYKKMCAQAAGRPKFILNDGPPYANGHLHLGHALNKILKDIVLKLHRMLGYDAPFVPGWDCHGLPIEWKVEENYRSKGLNKDEVSLLEFRRECHQFANKWIGVQREEFKRLGVIGDWDNFYTTMSQEADADIVEQLGIFLLNGAIYRGLRPVMWSVVEKTSLAEAEIEYHERSSDSIYVSFPIIHSSLPNLGGVEMAIWTTTPWTLPGNRAIAYGEEFAYAIIYLPHLKKKVLVAEELVEPFVDHLQCAYERLEGTIAGAELKGTLCAHPLRGQGYDFTVPLLPGPHVTTENGTGLVHTAPGHGVEDFEIGQRFKLDIPETVGPDGYFSEQVPLFKGMHVFKVNPAVIEALTHAGNLLHAGKVMHSYPHSWRSKAPLIFRTTVQWFISIDANNLRSKALQAVEEVEWFPKQGRNRIRSMIENRPDWCISRQRAWGSPITLFVHKETGAVLRDPAVHQRIVDAIATEGADVWYNSPPQRFLGPDYNPDDYEASTDILDVWFESACTHSFVLKKRPELRFPADLYLEGSDQHRAWFQVSLLEACGTLGQSPYRQVFTHGFLLDERGYKMSKSLGNIITPQEVINKAGSDILRLWTVSVNVTEDMSFGASILKQLEDTYRRYRNTLRYLLGSLDGFNAQEKLAYQDLPLLEKWLCHRLYQLDQQLRLTIPKYNLLAFYSELYAFCNNDLSAFYFDIRKDCLYCDPASSLKRRATRTMMQEIFQCLVHWLAPVLSFTAEEAYMASHNNASESIHLELFPPIPAEWQQPQVYETLERIRNLRRVITGAIEIERASKTIGSSLQANVMLYVTKDWADFLKEHDLAELSITSAVQTVIAQPPIAAFTLPDIRGVGAVITLSSGEKCERCWKVLPEVRSSDKRLCGRCSQLLEG